MNQLYNSTFEDCLSNLENLIKYDSENYNKRNEATTRLHLIDTLLFDCLGWEKWAVTAEEHQRTDRNEYTDYTFFAPRRIMILEAKRAGEYFDIPVAKVAITYALKSICKNNGSLKNAVEQVSKYCQSRGVPLGIACNGHQLVAFLANRDDGVAPMDGKALVFSSLRHMHENFIDLWNALSKNAVEDQKLKNRLIGRHRPELPPRLSESLSPYPGTKGRNVIQSEFQYIAESVIEDIPESSEAEQEFLSRCYCQSGALSQHSLVSKTILMARYSALFDEGSPGRPATTPASGRKGVSKELYAESLARRPILLLGDVGVGKSMFIRNLIRVEAAEIFDKAITIRIDLGSSAVLATDLKQFMLHEIRQQLAEKYGINILKANLVRGVYDLQLKEFKESIYGDLAQSNPERYAEKELEFLENKINNAAEHCRMVVEHLSKAWKKQVVIFVDNADQRSDSTQDEAFLIAQEIADKWSALVYIPLRPETFHRSVGSGALSGYHPKSFTIAPPRIDRVLDQRLRYAIKIAGDLANSQGKERKEQIEKLILVMKSFLNSLEARDDLVECIDNLSGGNVRLALDLTKKFFGSGHVDTQKIAEKASEGTYIIPLHEFLRAAIYGDNVHFHPDQSPFANLFDISSKESGEHFLLSILLSHLRQEGHRDLGFVETSELYQSLQGLGFSADQIDFAVVRGYRKHLVTTPGSQTPGDGSHFPKKLRATTVGLYHIDRLLESFPYVDAVLVSTPILDSETRNAIVETRSLAERFDRCKAFAQYLDRQWEQASLSDLAFQWPSRSKALKNGIEVARKDSLRQRY